MFTVTKQVHTDMHNESHRIGYQRRYWTGYQGEEGYVEGRKGISEIMQGVE